LALALVALMKAKASGLSRQFADALRISIATMRANWPIRPKQWFDVGESHFFSLKLVVLRMNLLIVRNLY